MNRAAQFDPPRLHDVAGRESIVRAVLTARRIQAAIVRTEATESGWRVILKDLGDRVFAMDVPNSSPAAIRAAMEQWADTI